ncbi:hypothetical protein [Bacillus badius]|uniref:Uncharacterized protein n=1 Tax=Bacillus badius TaxID=1455 RepID=A0ABR5ARK9_BACBA|nr:hypothetical protein [Bacillus badius]KIL72474.1 hypothetical protein SD78_4371 [Bacillus badius]KIL77367.1 hypothetical protein SD77_1610 [Bacillus badius]KZR58010.1 hypothetical protein A3781_01270 [Bacillus badius]MED4718587.1 hypothetical protein [Bacillus badius]
MMDHTEASWKNENVISQLRNSIDNVAEAMGQAQSNPTAQAIQRVQNTVHQADSALQNAWTKSEHAEPIQRLEEQLNYSKKQLEQLKRNK